jgi:hypothetical protein
MEKSGSTRRRSVYFYQVGRFIDTPVYKRTALPRGSTLRDPVVVDEVKSTIVCGLSGRLRLDDAGHVTLRIEEGQQRSTSDARPSSDEGVGSEDYGARGVELERG